MLFKQTTKNKTKKKSLTSWIHFLVFPHLHLKRLDVLFLKCNILFIKRIWNTDPESRFLCNLNISLTNMRTASVECRNIFTHYKQPLQNTPKTAKTQQKWNAQQERGASEWCNCKNMSNLEHSRNKQLDSSAVLEYRGSRLLRHHRKWRYREVNITCSTWHYKTLYLLQDFFSSSELSSGFEN